MQDWKGKSRSSGVRGSNDDHAGECNGADADTAEGDDGTSTKDVGDDDDDEVREYEQLYQQQL